MKQKNHICPQIKRINTGFRQGNISYRAEMNKLDNMLSIGGNLRNLRIKKRF